MSFNRLIPMLKKGRETAVHAKTLSGVTTAVTQVNDSGVSVRSVRNVERANQIWVRLDETDTQTLSEDAREPVSVWNFKVPYKEGIYVILGFNRAGEMRIVDMDEQAMDDAYQELAGTFAVPERSGELVQEVVPGWRFKPLRVRPDVSGGLNVVIEDGIYFYGDDFYAWTDKTPIDLADISVSSSTKRAVIIGIDPTDNTSVTAYGDEVSLALPEFTIIDYIAVANANFGKIWLMGYSRESGVTGFQSIYDLIDLRPYVSVSGAASGAGFMPIDLDYELSIPANKQVAVRRLNVVAGGVITVDGVLDIF